MKTMENMQLKLLIPSSKMNFRVYQLDNNFFIYLTKHVIVRGATIFIRLIFQKDLPVAEFRQWQT